MRRPGPPDRDRDPEVVGLSGRSRSVTRPGVRRRSGLPGVLPCPHRSSGPDAPAARTGRRSPTAGVARRRFARAEAPRPRRRLRAPGRPAAGRSSRPGRRRDGRVRAPTASSRQPRRGPSATPTSRSGCLPRGQGRGHGAGCSGGRRNPPLPQPGTRRRRQGARLPPSQERGRLRGAQGQRRSSKMSPDAGECHVIEFGFTSISTKADRSTSSTRHHPPLGSTLRIRCVRPPGAA